MTHALRLHLRHSEHRNVPLRPYGFDPTDLFCRSRRILLGFSTSSELTGLSVRVGETASVSVVEGFKGTKRAGSGRFVQMSNAPSEIATFCDKPPAPFCCRMIVPS